jgi:hypothetical protein
MSAFDDRKAEAERARARLKSGLDTLRVRITPDSLMIDVKAAARKRVIALATTVAASPTARSAVAVGAISGGLAYLFRKPLLKALEARLTPETDDE